MKFLLSYCQNKELIAKPRKHLKAPYNYDTEEVVL
jgi:hypothetical protein